MTFSTILNRVASAPSSSQNPNDKHWTYFFSPKAAKLQGVHRAYDHQGHEVQYSVAFAPGNDHLIQSYLRDYGDAMAVYRSTTPLVAHIAVSLPAFLTA